MTKPIFFSVMLSTCRSEGRKEGGKEHLFLRGHKAGVPYPAQGSISLPSRLRHPVSYCMAGKQPSGEKSGAAGTARKRGGATWIGRV